MIIFVILGQIPWFFRSRLVPVTSTHGLVQAHAVGVHVVGPDLGTQYPQRQRCRKKGGFLQGYDMGMPWVAPVFTNIQQLLRTSGHLQNMKKHTCAEVATKKWYRTDPETHASDRFPAI